MSGVPATKSAAWMNRVGGLSVYVPELEVHRILREALAELPRVHPSEAADILSVIAICEVRLCRYDDAIEHFERALRLDSPMALIGLAICHIDIGDFDKALGVLRQLTTEQPDNPVAWANLAEVLERLGEREAARGAFARAMQLAKNSRSAGLWGVMLTQAAELNLVPVVVEVRDRMIELLGREEVDARLSAPWSRMKKVNACLRRAERLGRTLSRVRPALQAQPAPRSFRGGAEEQDDSVRVFEETAAMRRRAVAGAYGATDEQE